MKTTIKTTLLPTEMLDQS